MRKLKATAPDVDLWREALAEASRVELVRDPRVKTRSELAAIWGCRLSTATLYAERLVRQKKAVAVMIHVRRRTKQGIDGTYPARGYRLKGQP